MLPIDHDAARYSGKSLEEIGPQFKALSEEWQNVCGGVPPKAEINWPAACRRCGS